MKKIKAGEKKKKKKNIVSNIKDRFKYDIKKMEMIAGRYDVNANVILHQDAIMKAYCYFAVTQKVQGRKEIMGWLAGKVDKNKIEIVDTYIGDCNSSSAYTELDPKETVKMMNIAKERGLQLIGQWHCLPGNELIYTDKGPVEIKNLEGNILVYDFINDKYFYSNNYKIFTHNSDSIVKIETKLKRTFTATSQHLMPVLKSGHLAWMTMDKINKGDYLCIPNIPLINKKHSFGLDIIDKKIKRKNSIKNEVKLPKMMTDKLALFLGLVFSDGYVGKSEVCFTNKRRNNINLFNSLSSELFGISCKTNIIPDGYRSIATRIYSRKVVLFLQDVIGFSKKNIPSIFYSSNKSIIKSFIDGLIIGDGCVTKVNKNKNERVVRICLGEERVSQDLIYLLSLLDIKARLIKYKQNFLRKIKNYIYLVVYQENPTKYSDLFPIKNKSITRDRINKDIIKEYPAIMRNMKFVKVVKKNRININQKVYDIYVPKYHTFVAGHGPFISHNCHPGMCVNPSGEDTDTMRTLVAFGMKKPMMLIVNDSEFWLGTISKYSMKKVDFVIPPKTDNKFDMNLGYINGEYEYTVYPSYNYGEGCYGEGAYIDDATGVTDFCAMVGNFFLLGIHIFLPFLKLDRWVEWK